MNYIFVSPQFPKCYYNFAKQLKEKGINVLGIGDTPYDALSYDVKSNLTEYYYLPNMNDYNEMVKAVGYFTFKYGKIDWLESNNEYWLTSDAKLREDFNITTGMHLSDVAKVRRKSAMKKYYKEAGVKTARYILVDKLEDGLKFTKEVGYPVFVKPDDGMGAEDSYSIHNEKELKEFYKNKNEYTSYIMEEYIDGNIFSYDGVVDSNGNIIFEAAVAWPKSVAAIVNNKLELVYSVMNTIPNDLREKGQATLKSFGVKGRIFHLEFFRLTSAKEGLGKVDDIVALEVNMRPAGGWTLDMYNFAYSVNIYDIYANMVAGYKPFIDLSLKKYVTVYASRRNNYNYLHSNFEINDKYRNKIVLNETIDPLVSGAMGDYMWVVKLDSEKEKENFIKFVTKKIA